MSIHKANDKNKTNETEQKSFEQQGDFSGFNQEQNFQQQQYTGPNSMEDALHTADGTTYQNPEERFNQNSFSWLHTNGIMPYQVNSSPASASLSTLQAKLKEYWDDNLSPDLVIDMIPIDKSTAYNLGVSLLVFAVRDNRSDTAPVAHHTLILEGSIDNLPPRYDNINGRQVEVMRLVSDMYDPTMRDIISNVVIRNYPKASAVLTAHASVVNKGFDVNDETNIRNLTVNAVVACRRQLLLADPSFPDIDLALARKDSATLTQTNVFSKDQTEFDLTSLPVRADIIMTMTANPINSKADQFNAASSVITRSTGFINLLYLDSNNLASCGGRPQFDMYGRPVPTPIYQAELVLTQLCNPAIQSTPGFLLALINAYSVSESRLWLRTFLSKPSNGLKDMSDIGNIGYDIQVGEPDVYDKIKTSPAEFGMRELELLYNRFFHPNLAISLDIPDCGAQTWAYQTFAAAAYGNPQAMQHIRDACNILTHGCFEEHYNRLNGNGQLVFTNFNRILLGYYTAEDGSRRDIRDLDYLAVCGIAGPRDRSEIADYTDTYNSNNYAWQDRLNIRRQMISNYLRNVTFTNYGLRVSFSKDMIEALVRGAYDCGYRVTPQSPYMADMSYQRANAGYITGAVLDSVNSGIFTNTVNYQNNPGYNGGNFSNWGGQNYY